jgi:hypothetical protein
MRGAIVMAALLAAGLFAHPLQAKDRAKQSSSKASSSKASSSASAPIAVPYYRNCSEARAAGVAPIRYGEPGYASHLDRDRDGIACEPYPKKRR